MAYGNRIQDVTTSSGTGAVTLSGTPAATFRALTTANIGIVGTTFDYTMINATDFEDGVGTITGNNAFTRAPVDSSNGGAAVSFAAGATFFVTVGAATFASFLTAAVAATLSNKRLVPRVLALSGAIGSPTYSTDSYDVVECLAVSANITSFTTNLTGTPNKGDTLTFHITDNGTARTIGWGTMFEDSTLTKPATTVVSQKLSVWFEWNAATSKWRLAGYA